MILKKRYTTLNEVLMYIKIQSVDSLPFAAKVCPNFENAEDLFYWLKKKTKYKNDPKGIELLQTMQTLFKNGGRGDCDCFVITSLACFIVLGFDNVNICLVGRERSHPVHIYTALYDDNGNRFVFDLTNRHFNQERNNYNYIQELPVNWQNWRGIKKYL